MPETSTKPYLLRAIYEWCTDNGYTPYLATVVDARTHVPREFVKNGEIVLNISFTATSGLKMENELITFNARFGGVSREISVPVDNVLAIYARENGQGMAFEVSKPSAQSEDGAASVLFDDETSSKGLTAVPSATSGKTPPDQDPDPPKKGDRPTLTRIK